MQQIQQLIEESLQIEKGMRAYWGNTNRFQELDPALYTRRLKGKIFAIAGFRVIGFSAGDKDKMYITPYTDEAVGTLRNHGYREYAFFVPLSPPEMTLVDEELAAKWQSLLERSSRKAESTAADA